MNVDAPGKGYLKTCGIILIILSIINAVMILAGILGGTIVVSGVVGVAAAVTVGIAVLIVLALSVSFNLIAGILGVKNAERPEKYKSCYVFGILMVIFSGLSVLSKDTKLTISALASLALSILYLVGAVKNRAAYLQRGNAGASPQ